MRPKRFDAITDEHLRRMGEPEPLRSLRRQLERIEDAERRALDDLLAAQEAESIRQEIKRRGHKPCA